MNPIYIRAFLRTTALLIVMALLSGMAIPVLAVAGTTTRVSVDSSGAQGNEYSHRPDISNDGRYVAFESVASNLVSGDTGGFSDAFVHDRQTGGTVRVSVAAGEVQANGDSGTVSISGDGRFIAFESNATNLVSGDANSVVDLFVADQQTGSVMRVSVASNGVEANGPSSYPAISADGRYVAFISEATNLVNGDTNGLEDIFVHDRLTAVTTRVSIDSSGTQANAASSIPSISSDGRYVAFSSGATNLVGGDTNNKTDVFVRDRQTGVTTRVSVNSSGVQADRGASNPFISDNGRFVTFASSSTNLIPQDTFSFTHIYVHDRATGTTTLASIYADGSMLIGNSDEAVISTDGRYVAYQYDDRGDGQAIFELRILDRVTGGISVVPHGSNSIFVPVISGDGRIASFASSDPFVSGDTNGFFDVFVYEVAYTPDLNPTVTSVETSCASGCTYPTGDVVSFNVTFSEIVSGVTADDFSLAMSGSISGASIANVSGSGSQFVVTVNSGAGDGSLRLDIVDNDTIKDVSGNLLGGVGIGNGNFNTGNWYIVHKSLPMVASVLRVETSPTANNTVHFNVTFSEAVSGVNASDFSIAASGVIGASVVDVSGAGNTYNITVNTGTGDGTLRLDLLDDDSILDPVNIPLGGAGAGNGNFTSGEFYVVNRFSPTVISILRTDAHPTAAAVVHFNVTFSEPVSGVDIGDFLLTASGISGAVVTDAQTSGNISAVTVNTGTGNGTLRLDLVDNDSITDSYGYPLGGAGVGNGNFNIGETYIINKITYITVTEKLRSGGRNDGWILESKENSNQGYARNSTAATFILGDNATDRQYRSILHFATSYLPDNAVVTKAILMIKLQGVMGTDPFQTHGNITIDIRYGPFSSGIFSVKTLQASDFQAPASLNSVGLIQNNPVDGWYWAMLDSSALPYINLTGVTQLRLAFQLDDNDDFEDDYLTFFSGDYVRDRDRPHLLIEYYRVK